MKFSRELINDFPLSDEDKKKINHPSAINSGKNMRNTSSRSAWDRILGRKNNAQQASELTKLLNKAQK